MAFLCPFVGGSLGGLVAGKAEVLTACSLCSELSSYHPPDVFPPQDPPDLGNRRGGEPPKAGAGGKTALSWCRIPPTSQSV